MKKLTAMICAAVLSLSTVCVAFANPNLSIKEVTIEKQDAKVDATTAQRIPEGKKLVVKEIDLEKVEYKEEKVVEVVKKLNDPKETITTEEILDTLKPEEWVKGEKFKTWSSTGEGTVIEDPTKYEPITKFADLCITDNDTETEITYKLDGTIQSVKATVQIEALKQTEEGKKIDIKNILLMQIDPETGDVYFIEIKEEDYDPETGEITVEFPCLGPFTVLEKPAETAE